MRDDEKKDIIDEDLYEEIDDETLLDLVEEERKKALRKAAEERENNQTKRPFPKWVFWLIAAAMLINVIAILPQTFSIPAIEFIQTSARLSAQEDIQEYKQAVVVIETDDSKGTGFAINENGKVLTNHHVIEGEETVTVAFPDDGLYSGQVVESFPEIDLAIVQTEDADSMPFLELADETKFGPEEPIYFIGNPLAFNGIANEGTVIDYIQLSSWSANLPVIMIQAPVYRGNSGSPIINMDGEVIGVVFATLKDEEHGKVGLFVPIDYYYQALQEYKKGG